MSEEEVTSNPCWKGTSRFPKPSSTEGDMKIHMFSAQGNALEALSAHYPFVVYLSYSLWRKMLVFIPLALQGGPEDETLKGEAGTIGLLLRGKARRSTIISPTTLGVMGDLNQFTKQCLAPNTMDALRARQPLCIANLPRAAQQESVAHFLRSLLVMNHGDVFDVMLKWLKLSLTDIWPIRGVNVVGSPLLCAAVHVSHHTVIPALLLKAGAEMKGHTIKGQTALHLAAAQGHQESTMLLLKNGGHAFLDAKNTDGGTPLLVACESGKMATVSVLLEAGANPDDAIPGERWSCLHFAAFYGFLGIVKVLLEAGANIDILTTKDKTPVAVAAAKGQHEVIKLLVESGASLSKRNTDGGTALLVACESGKAGAVEALLAGGADPSDSIPGENWTGLHFAAYHGYLGVVKVLLKAGTDIDVLNAKLKTPLSLAATNGKHEVVKFLLANGANKETRNSDGRTALLVACEGGQTEAVEALLAGGADPSDEVPGEKWTGLHFAAHHGYLGVVKVLLKAGVDVNAPTLKRKTPLALAAGNGKEEVVTHLLHSGANTALRNTDGGTALLVACESGKAGAVQALLAGGADPSDSIPGETWTGLHFAAYYGYLGVVKVLLKAGTDIDVLNAKQKTPLALAAMSGKEEVIKLLVESGANIGLRNSDGWTALFVACESGKAEVVQALLTGGADPSDATPGENWSCLLLAASRNSLEITKILLSHPRTKVNYQHGPLKWTALDCAVHMGHRDMKELLTSHGATCGFQNHEREEEMYQGPENNKIRCGDCNNPTRIVWRYVYGYGGWKCNACKGTVSTVSSDNRKVAHCSKCEFDLCQNCWPHQGNDGDDEKDSEALLTGGD